MEIQSMELIRQSNLPVSASLPLEEGAVVRTGKVAGLEALEVAEGLEMVHRISFQADLEQQDKAIVEDKDIQAVLLIQAEVEAAALVVLAPVKHRLLERLAMEAVA